jgi:ATP-dependent helicase/nuclease subunit B
VSKSDIFFERIARQILNKHDSSLPDLRGITILLPNFHAAQPLAQALMRTANRPALLLPQMVTLNEWAQRIAIDQPLIPDSRRSALLYQELRKHERFAQYDLWGIAKELLTLFDELTHSLSSLPADEDEFAEAIQAAYQARQNSALQFEARLVFELWHAMHSGAEWDAARAYQQRLAQLAAQATQPLFVLRTSDWSALENNFLHCYAKNAPVVIADLREMADENVISMALSARPSQEFSAPENVGEMAQGSEIESLMREQAAYLQLQNIPSLGNSLRFFPATSLEQEARAAAMQVRLWLQEGKHDIAIVAQDRVVARRMRALLERAEILVADETGWTFATLSVSTVLDRWLSALQSNFYYHVLLDLLKSPFIFADLPGNERKTAVYQLEQLLRKHGVVQDLDQFMALTAEVPVLQGLLKRLLQAATFLEKNKKKSLAGWLDGLYESLRITGIDTGMQKDSAGAQLWQALQTWRVELSGDSGRYGFNEWRRWLAQQLDGQTYRDTEIESPVRFTHLAATRWRRFDAVLLLGCGAEHLPSVADSGRWFNDAVRNSLNLPTRGMHAARQRDDLLGLLTLNECVRVTWQVDKNGEEGLLSPYLEMLRDLHDLAYRDDLVDKYLLNYLLAEDVHSANMAMASPPLPVLTSAQLPQKVSISAYNSLVACPYQFYARYILRLNELDEVQEEIEKSDYGNHVHIILQKFHERYACLNEHSPEQLLEALSEISAAVFADLLQQNFVARAWLARWNKTLPAYLEWQLNSEAEGWRYVQAESEFNLELDGVILRGRIDRLDRKGGETRVLDYKTQSDALLRNKLKEPGEDVQLACYAFAEQAGEAIFVSLDNGKVRSVQAKQDIGQLADLTVKRLEQVMQAMQAGAALPANGIDAACAYCEIQGLCRKGEWL